MKSVKLVIIAAVALFAIACGDPSSTNQTASTAKPQSTPSASPKVTVSASPTPADEMASARATFNQVCSACHQESGEGGPVKLQNGKTLKVPNLKEGHALKHTDEEFAKQIREGGDGMPPFKDKLTPEQINGLVKFIRSEIQGGTAPKAGD